MHRGERPHHPIIRGEIEQVNERHPFQPHQQRHPTAQQRRTAEQPIYPRLRAPMRRQNRQQQQRLTPRLGEAEAAHRGHVDQIRPTRRFWLGEAHAHRDQRGQRQPQHRPPPQRRQPRHHRALPPQQHRHGDQEQQVRLPQQHPARPRREVEQRDTRGQDHHPQPGPPQQQRGIGRKPRDHRQNRQRPRPEQGGQRQQQNQGKRAGGGAGHRPRFSRATVSNIVQICGISINAPQAANAPSGASLKSGFRSG